MPPINSDALIEANYPELSAAQRRRLRAVKDPYSRKETMKSLRQMTMGALHELGGQKWLVEQANRYPVAFMALVAKNLPFERKADGDGEMRIVVITVGNGKVMRQEARGVINTPLELIDETVIDAEP